MSICIVFDRHLDDAALDPRQYRRDREVNASIGGKRVVVGHRYEQQGEAENAAKRRGRKRPLVDRNSENLEHGDAKRHVGQGEYGFHERPPVSVPSSESAMPIVELPDFPPGFCGWSVRFLVPPSRPSGPATRLWGGSGFARDGLTDPGPPAWLRSPPADASAHPARLRPRRATPARPAFDRSPSPALAYMPWPKSKGMATARAAGKG